MATILIVDDRAANRDLLATILGYKGHRVLEAGDGKEALASVKRERPDLIISDILMPTMDGYEFVRWLRTDPNTADIPVIFSTAHYLDREAAALAKACGVSQTVYKPLDPETVLSAVDAALGVVHGDVPPLPPKFDREHMQLLTDKLSQRTEDLRRANERLSALIELGHQIAGEHNPLQLLENFCHAARSIIGAKYAALAVLDDEGQTLQHFLTSGVESHVESAIGQKPVGGGSLRTAKIQEHPDSEGFPPNHPEMTSFLGAAISSSTGIYGSLYLTDKVGLDEFSEADEKLVTMLAQQVGIAYENAKRNEELKRRATELEGTMIQRKRAEEALRETNQTLQSLVQTSPVGIIAYDLEGNVKSWNAAAERIFGWSEAEAIGLRNPIVPDDQWEDFSNTLDITHRSGMFTDLESSRITKEGRMIDVSLSSAPLADGRGNVHGSVTVIADITERKQLEDQFLHAQKMEAVGRLAGGVAHDFNNLLTAIIGYSQLGLSRLHSEDPMRKELEEIERAGQRAAALTGQLLAFSRRQVLQPQVLDLNSVVGDLGKMLHRLIGEDIELDIRLSPELGHVRADRGQLDQIIMNLAVNSRDAMPEGGKLTIETANVELDESYATEHVDARAGRHVMLAISDNGAGMDKETRSRVFEPFFTTKEQGKGTGLGLSTVYGIVKQSGGHIGLYSEPGMGTTFKIYLPEVEDELDKKPTPTTAAGYPKRHETALLVEDEASFRKLARTILERNGYKVIEAASGDEASVTSGEYAGRIDLMLTDVVMPGTSGRELAQVVASARPEMKVLYMSGYTDDAIVHHGILDADTPFIQKPFNPETLLQRVRDLLDAEDLPPD